jgi:hypothetical protein
MSRFVLLYTFNRADKVSLHRLMRLQKLNPNVTIVPVFGVAQTLTVPMPKLPKRYRDSFNWEACKSKTLFKVTKAINKPVESLRRRSELNATRKFVKRLGLKLYCDFTPIGKINQDLAIINWFREQGVELDFDYAIYFEYDMYATRSIQALYSPYLDFDAGFVNYRVAEPTWMWYDRPSGANRSVTNWLKKRGAHPVIHRSFLPGHFLSRQVLKNLAQINDMPNAFNEMRLASVVSGLGFKIARLDFPKVHVTIEAEGILEHEIRTDTRYGVFHPVYGDFDV